MAIEALLKGGKVLRLGDQGEVVRTLQVALAVVGYPLRGTGYFGGATDTAVTDFQKRQGLDPDGVVGPGTAGMLDSAVEAKSRGREVLPAESMRPLWLQAGLKLINVTELPGGADNPEILAWAKEEGGGIAKDYKHDSIAWCALFANHILTKVGLKGTETLWALDFAGHWPATKLTGPAVGAFAPMQRPGGGHIICVVGRDQNGNIMGLGGNQKDQVSILPFPVKRLDHGFYWPAGVTPPAAVGMALLPVVRSSGRLSKDES